MPGAESGSLPSVADLARSLRALELRVAALEARLVPAAASPEPEPDLRPTGAATATAETRGTWLPGLGLMMLVLAGGFLVRALTGAGALRGDVGVALGILYALSCLLLAGRRARGADRATASLLGTGSALIAYPLLWETATKLDLLSAPAAAALLAVVAATGLAVTLRNRLWGLGWLHVAAALAVATGLAWQSGAPVLLAGEVVALGAATALLAQVRNWWGPRWLAAAVANALVLLLVLLASLHGEVPPGRPDPGAAATLVLALGLPAAYLAVFCPRLLAGRGAAGPFEAVQSAGCLAVGLLGAAFLLRSKGAETARLGWWLLPAAVAAQAVALGRGRNRPYFAALGLGLTLLATALIAGPWPARLWALLGVAAAALAGRRPGRWLLRLQGAVFLTGAALAGGLFKAALAVAFGSGSRLPLRPTSGGGAAWLAAIAGYGLLVAGAGESPVALRERVLRFAVAAAALAGTLTLLGETLASVAGDGPATADPVVLRTFLLAAMAVATAAASRRSWARELAWFVGPCLLLAGLALLLDLGRASPASLFVGFACFGLALLVAPRLRRRGGPGTPETRRPAPAAAPPADRP